MIEVIRKRREKEGIRLVKMAGSEDVGFQSKHGLMQLHWPTLVEAVETMKREEDREARRKGGMVGKLRYNMRRFLGWVF